MNTEEQKSRVLTILDSLKQAPANIALSKKVDILTFLISLLPIPGVSQAGQIANKVINDAALSTQLDGIRADIFAANQRIDGLESELIRVGEIAKTVSSVTVIESRVQQFCEQILQVLKEGTPQLHIETTNWSVQRFIDALIQVNWVAVTADNNSRNHFQNTRAEAENTYLRAHNHSENTFEGTTFVGRTGSVGMHRLSQSGNNSVSGASVGFGPGGRIGFGEGGTLSFGAPSNEIFADCPTCHKRIYSTKTALQGKNSIQCPHCNTIHPFHPPA